MLSVFLGTDRKKARAAARYQGEALIISDAHAVQDLRAALAQGASMFGDLRTVILDGVCENAEMRALLVAALPALAQSPDRFFVLEEKPDAALKKLLQKYAEKVEILDAPKKKEYPTVFKLADHLKKGDKKSMWVAYQRELGQGSAPEQIHGVLFWGAKQFLLGARDAKDAARARSLVAALAEMPHQARRQGEDLEYALERFILS